jgi:hypothetical protein
VTGCPLIRNGGASNVAANGEEGAAVPDGTAGVTDPSPVASTSNTSPGRGGLFPPRIDRIAGSCATRFTRTARLAPFSFCTTTSTDAPPISNGTCALIKPGDRYNSGAATPPNSTRTEPTCVGYGGPATVWMTGERFAPKIDTSEPGASCGDNELRKLAEFTIPDGLMVGACACAVPANNVIATTMDKPIRVIFITNLVTD